MANEVYANGREIACKAGAGRVTAATPDVCLSPPSPPAGPVPVPYPVSSFASDTTSGSKSVKISGEEVMLKDKSKFKKCTGDEAATKGLGMSVVTHNITGHVYFAAWSSDVEIEGENAVRHLDITTSNHMCQPGSTPPMVETDAQAMADDCKQAGEVATAAVAELPPSKKKKAFTVTVGKLSIPGQGAMFLKACSKGLAGAALTFAGLGGWCAGITPGAASNVPGHAYKEIIDKLGRVFMPKSSHAEARIIEDCFKAIKPNTKFPPGTKLRLRIRWHSKSATKFDPCPHCKALIDKAKEAGLDIEVC